MNGFNHELFDESVITGCSCGCQFVLKHENGVDITIHQGIPKKVELPIGVYIPVNYDDHIYYVTNEEPGIDTTGEVGDVAINLWDMRSWRCTASDTSEQGLTTYTWEEDSEFTPRRIGDAFHPMIYHYYKDKKYEFKVKNSRFEDIYTEVVDAASPFVYTITGTLLDLLRKGTYPYELTLLTRVPNTEDELYVPKIRMADSSNSTILVI